MAESPNRIFLKDYQKPTFTISHVDLEFDLFEDKAIVTSFLKIRGDQKGTLVLNGEKLKLISLEINDQTLQEQHYLLNETMLTIPQFPTEATLKVVTEINPANNTALEGLYKSAGGFCTQNEPQGFRKITYFIDRPDVMSKYDVVIKADKTKYPILLANGNCVKTEDLTDGRHMAHWRDPWPKPCYLFALVAGDYGVVKDYFTTMSGKKVSLEIYCDHGQEARCHHAMESLKRSMKWDEEKYGREYDLDRYLILAVNDFNAGAMENKGLNIFNSRLVLASSDSATDYEYEMIEAVIAHEYFHNWTGNRVTLRDWFHLSLKEGLTVFRDQQYTSDQTSPGVKRIDDVQGLRDGQFTEDAGPNAHPVRPSSVIAVDNFFTATIYEKGSEVIRMIYSMIGQEKFRKGMDLYFSRHDGQAVTIEEFVKCHEEAAHIDLTQFRRWYDQAGTPEVKISESFDDKTKIYELTISQSCRPTPQQPEKMPFHIPIKIGLLNSKGEEPQFEFSDADQRMNTTQLSDGHVLHLKNSMQTFSIKGFNEKPYLSPLRDFSAPVNLNWQATTNDLLFLATHDSDGFNRWEAGQKILLNELLRIYSELNANVAGEDILVSAQLLSGVKNWLAQGTDYALTAKMLSLPSQDYFLQKVMILHPQNISLTYRILEEQIARAIEEEINQKLESIDLNPNDLNFKSISGRSLFTKLLRLKAHLPQGPQYAFQIFNKDLSMTLNMAALNALNQSASQERSVALSLFFNRWKNDALVMNKYFKLVGGFESTEVLSEIQALEKLPQFNIKNPNNVYGLLGTFSWYNLVGFNNKAAYMYMSEKIRQLDALNPQVAARMCQCFESWKKLPADLKESAGLEIEKIVKHESLSKNTFELIKNIFDN